MAGAMGPVSNVHGGPAWGVCILAGVGAGVVAALASVGALVVLHASLPPRVSTLWSALVAGILGGIVYGWLARTVRRPAAALWVVTLLIATIDSLLIAFVPSPEGRGRLGGIPITGLVVPIRQLLALVGIGHLGTRHFPPQYLPAVTATHYITAVAVSLVVPWLAKPKAR